MSDGEIISAMKDAAERLFEEAADKHFFGKYSDDPEERKAGYERWKKGKERMRQLIAELRKATAGR